MKTSASIVLYNSCFKEISLVVSRLVQVPEIIKVYLIDNGGSDFAKRLNYTFGENVIYIRSPKNIGYGAGHNIAIKNAEKINSDLHIVMNSDISFEPKQLQSFLKKLSTMKSFFIAGPKILNPNDYNMSYFKYSPALSQMVKRFFNSGKYKYNLQMTNFAADIFHCPYLSGAFIVFKVTNLKRLGYFDERFFMYPEDIDISLRATILGGSIGLRQFTVVHDHRAESKKSWKLLFYHIVNMLKFYWKWRIEKRVDLKAANKRAGTPFISDTL